MTRGWFINNNDVAGGFMNTTLNQSILTLCFILFFTGCATNTEVTDGNAKPVKDIALSNIWVSSLFEPIVIM
mgnify:CR=1 FL=1